MTDIKINLQIAGADQVARSVKIVEKAVDQSAIAQVKAAEKVAKAEEKAREKSVKAADKAEQQKARAAEKTFRYLDGIRSRYFAKEQAEATASANKRIKEEERAAKAIAKARNESLGKVGDVMGSTLKGVAAGAIGLGTMVVGAVLRESMKVQALANRISINARLPGQKAVDPTELRKEFEETAKATPGVKAEDVATGMLNYVNLTGDLQTGRKMSGTFAKVSQASGAKMEDVSTTAASLSQKFGIKSEAEMQQAFASMVAIGKTGAMPIDQIAAQFSKISAAAQRFGFSGAKGVNELAGLVNISRTATGGPEQASVALEEGLSHIIQNAMKLKGQGVNVFDKKGHTRDIQDVLVDMVSKVGGKNMALKKIQLQEYMGIEGVRAISPLMSTYENTFQNTKGTDAEKVKAAVSALRDQLHGAIDSTAKWSDVEQDAAQVQQSTGAQLEAAWQNLVSNVSEKVVPAFTNLVPKLLQLVPLIEPVGEAFVAIAEAGQLVVDLFKWFGLIHPKVETSGEAVQRTEKALDKYDKSMEGIVGPRSPEQDAERGQLVLAAEEAQEQQKKMKFYATESDEHFAQDFAEAGGGDEYRRKANYQGGLGVAKRLSEDPTMNVQHGMYTPEQQEMLNQRKAALMEAASKTETDAKLKAAKAALTVAQALDKVTAAANRMKPINER